MKRLFAALFCLLLLPEPGARAHPHVFIDAGLTLLFDRQGRLAAVQVFWAYDEYTSLLQLEDMGLDRDGDGVLTPDEQRELAGYDTNWVDGYEGDIYLTHAGAPISLAGPIEPGARLENGQIVTWHIRPVINRLTPEENHVEIKVYDPSFYVAYTVDLGVRTSGREGCDTAKLPADLGKAYDLVEELLYGPSAASDAGEDNFPMVGEHFADTITLSCVPGS
ncbi:MAG: DUF1007 family protein [Pseudomonadota bacterium]